MCLARDEKLKNNLTHKQKKLIIHTYLQIARIEIHTHIHTPMPIDKRRANENKNRNHIANEFRHIETKNKIKFIHSLIHAHTYVLALWPSFHADGNCDR